MRYCPECRSVSPDVADRCTICGDTLPIELSKELIDGRFKTIEEVGRGAMGVVWHAQDVALRRDVALKFLSPRYANQPDALRRFQREAAALASIRSKHVAQIFSFGIDYQTTFFAMEYVEGTSCDDIIEQYAKNDTYIPVHRALVILREIAAGLTAVHGSGIVHRDIKPDNVVVERGTGRTVLVDFGLASTAEGMATANVGTPAYMAPEQIRATERLSPRTDVYGLGCTAFHMLTNQLVFETDKVYAMIKHQCETTPRKMSEVRPELAPLDAVIAKALEKEAKNRYASTAEFISALAMAGQGWLEPTPLKSLSHSGPPSTEEVVPVAARILVVDDDDDFAKLSVRAAQLAFFGTAAKVARARSGEEALSNAAHKAPQLVLLDFEMPGLDGVETLSRLRELPGAQDTRVIVISATVGSGQRWRFDALGIDGFLRKPVELRELVDVIGALGRARGWIPVVDDVGDLE